MYQNRGRDSSSPEANSDRASSSDEIPADVIEGSPPPKDDSQFEGLWYAFEHNFFRRSHSCLCYENETNSLAIILFFEKIIGGGFVVMMHLDNRATHRRPVKSLTKTIATCLIVRKSRRRVRNLIRQVGIVLERGSKLRSGKFGGMGGGITLSK